MNVFVTNFVLVLAVLLQFASYNSTAPCIIPWILDRLLGRPVWVEEVVPVDPVVVEPTWPGPIPVGFPGVPFSGIAEPVALAPPAVLPAPQAVLPAAPAVFPTAPSFLPTAPSFLPVAPSFLPAAPAVLPGAPLPISQPAAGPPVQNPSATKPSGLPGTGILPFMTPTNFMRPGVPGP